MGIRFTCVWIWNQQRGVRELGCSFGCVIDGFMCEWVDIYVWYSKRLILGVALILFMKFFCFLMQSSCLSFWLMEQLVYLNL